MVCAQSNQDDVKLAVSCLNIFVRVLSTQRARHGCKKREAIVSVNENGLARRCPSLSVGVGAARRRVWRFARSGVRRFGTPSLF